VGNGLIDGHRCRGECSYAQCNDGVMRAEKGNMITVSLGDQLLRATDDRERKYEKARLHHEELSDNRRRSAI
jgi:hypothetical protein